MGRCIESKPVTLTKKNGLKQSKSSPANLKNKPRGLSVANNNIYRKYLLFFDDIK